MKVRCLKGTALVEMLDEKPVSDGGIFIPNPRDGKPKEAKIIGIGRPEINKKGKIMPVDCHVGDRVIISHRQGTTVKALAGRYKIVPQRSILAVVEQTA